MHTSVHENYFNVREICFGVHEIKLETHARYYWVADEEQKNVWSVFISNFETYTRYFCVEDEEQK